MADISGDVVELSLLDGNANTMDGASGDVALPAGTSNYEDLENKPKINGVELIGDKTNEELGIDELSNQDIETLINNFV